MDFEFASKRLRRQMTNGSELQKTFGELTRPLQRRLGVLAKASNLAEVPRLPPERCHQLTGDLAGCFAVDLSRNKRLIFKPDHDPVPSLDDGGIDLESVTAIVILGVEDYH
jgi:proteic killer suppression protein